MYQPSHNGCIAMVIKYHLSLVLKYKNQYKPCLSPLKKFQYITYQTMMYGCPICMKMNVDYIFVLVVIVTTNAHTSCEIFKKNSLKLLPVESAQTQKCQNIVSFSTEKKNALSINIKWNIYSYINLDFHKFLRVTDCRDV